jgi:hypothetical protein
LLVKLIYIEVDLIYVQASVFSPVLGRGALHVSDARASVLCDGGPGAAVPGMISCSAFQLRGGMRGAAHLPSGVCVMRRRALLQEEIYGSGARLVGRAPTRIRISAIVIVSRPEIIAWRLQTQANLLGVGGRLAHTRMAFDIAIGQRHRDRVGIVLHGLIQLATLIL